ncbi:MAG TPA: sigma-70 family RNA polymerase sigma factor [Longimicrobium sp.]|nr:sigma-70 family RNA polymerase sigma factor [Longimicrobium sp.]
MVPPAGQPDPTDLFLAHRNSIEKIIAKVAYAKALASADADDFGQWVRTRLIENDALILRKFQGRAGIETYLTVVIGNLYRDYRVQEWGRWRPSVAAKRLGAEAMRLEALLYRDGYPLSQAITVMRSSGTELTERELHELAAQIPVRMRTRELLGVDAPDPIAAESADADIREAEDAREWNHVLAALNRALDDLPAEDAVIVRLRYLEAFSVADIARKLHLEQKPLYRRLDRVLVQLRERLVAEGVDRGALAFLQEESS